MPPPHVTFADSPRAVEDVLATLAELDTAGVDVERADSDRYFRAAALVQVGAGSTVAVIDPLAVPDLSTLDDFLATRTTVLHAAENDLGPLEVLGVTPPAVEDTAVAAALLGLPTGLDPLLADVLGVEADGDKQAMQRADWSARPLGERMLTYAAGDVVDLPALWEELAARLRATGRLTWYREELASQLNQPPVEERRAWTRTKGAGRLDGRARSRLRRLWEARERLARNTDTAPGRIVTDRVLVRLAEQPPSEPNELGHRGMRWPAVRRFGSELIDAVAAADAAPPERSHGNGRPPSREDRQRAEVLRDIRAERAEELGIDSGVLCPSRTLLQAVLADPTTGEELRAALSLRDWQWEQLAAPFCEALGLDAAGRDAAESSQTDDEEPRHG